MSGTRLARTTRHLVFALSALYVLAAITGVAFADFDTTTSIVIWLGLLCGGAVFMLVGQLASDYPGRASALLVSIGAVAGGLPLLWTIIIPIAVATVIACSIALARQPSVPA
jgi:hypothetical protein